MDVAKIQIEVLKALVNGNKVYYLKSDGNVLLSANSSQLFVIPEKDCYLTFGNREPVNGMKRIIDGLKNAVDANFNGKRVDIKEYTALILETDKYSVYVNEKLLKFFGKPKELHFRVTGELRPIGIYDKNSVLLGVITPLRKG